MRFFLTNFSGCHKMTDRYVLLLKIRGPMQENTKRKPGRPKNQALIKKRKEEILAAATAVFASQGYRNTDVQVIADILQVGKGTIYRYFPTKRELFLSTVDRGMELLKCRIHGNLEDVKDPLDKIVYAIERYLAFFETNPQLVELIIQERAEFKDRKKPTYFEHREVNISTWKELLHSLISQGRIRNLSVEETMDTMGDLLYGTIFSNYFSQRVKSHKTQAEAIIDMVFYGILSDEERKHRNSIRKG